MGGILGVLLSALGLVTPRLYSLLDGSILLVVSINGGGFLGNIGFPELSPFIRLNLRGDTSVLRHLCDIPFIAHFKFHWLFFVDEVYINLDLWILFGAKGRFSSLAFRALNRTVWVSSPSFGWSPLLIWVPYTKSHIGLSSGVCNCLASDTKPIILHEHHLIWWNLAP